MLRQSEPDEFHPEEFEEYLQGIKLDVKEDAEGYYATVRGDEFVEEHPEEEQTRQLRHLSNFIDSPDIFSVGRGEGKTVYVIQNLNINITAEVVHQLNVTPQKDINQYHELIKAEVEKMVKNKTK